MRYKYQIEFTVEIDAEDEQEAFDELNDMVMEQFDTSEEICIIKIDNEDETEDDVSVLTFGTYEEALAFVDKCEG